MSIHESLFREIAGILIGLNYEINRQNKMGRTDLKYEAEEIYCTVLNIVCDWKLRSVRQFRDYYPAVDLVDNEQRLAVQVTSNSDRSKIQYTLDRFFGYQMEKEYDRLIILLTGNGMRYRKRFRIEKEYPFNQDRDIWDESRLLHEIENVELEKLKRLRDYLWSQATGLGLPDRLNSQVDSIHELDHIIRDRIGLSSMIDNTLLDENTIHCNFEYLSEGVGLQTVRHLFVIASPEDGKRFSISEGGYISPDNSWLLLLCLPSNQVAAIIAQCVNLTSLVIRYHDFGEIALDHCRKLRKLEISANMNPIRFVGIDFFTTLEHLEINTTQMTAALDLRNAGQLRELRISRDGGKTSLGDMTLHRRTDILAVEVIGLDWCRSLEVLELRDAVIAVIDLDRLSNLKTLELVGTDTEIRVKNSHDHLTVLRLLSCHMAPLTFLPRLITLENLTVWNVTIQGQILNIPDLSSCEKLTEISFMDTKIHTVGKLPNRLSELNLSSTGLSRIPDSVRYVKHLRSLNLSGLHLRELPIWLAELGLPVQSVGVQPLGESRSVRIRLGLEPWARGILLKGTYVDGVDLRTIPEQQELLHEWLEALHDARNQIQNEVKVIFLGDGEAGKSHIIKRLESNGAVLTDFDGDATPGIAITSKMLDLSDRSVTVRAWDFGGQEILHAMHRIFMTKNTLYVVVLNARNDTQDHRAEHWLRFIYSFDKDARVMLVLNKIDQNPRASINLNRLRRMYPGLPDPIMLSAKEYSTEDFEKHFVEPLRSQLEQFEMLKSPFPTSWRQVQEKLEGTKKRYILAEDYEEYCEEVGITKDAVKNELVYRFMNLGVCFRCDGELGEAFLLLEPKWVTNAIYKILFNHHEKVHNGIISLADLKTCLTKGEKHKSVDQKLAYSKLEISYILQVMRSYGLSFSLDDDQENEFIPMLCDRNESPLVKEYADDPAVLEVWWQFDFLPDNLLFHLMVELSGELDTDHVWLSGARFRDPYTQHCMIVERDGRTLKLYAENKPGQGFARDHMVSMERNIRKVIDERFPGMVEQNDDSAPKAVPLIGHRKYPGIHRLLVHKLNGKRETFDLNRLEDNLNCQQHSTLLKTTILARDLLERCYRGMDPEQSLLIQDLVEGCVAIQGNLNPHENPRNTYIRDILQGKDYVVRDQTLCAKAEGQNEAGELDMEILRGARKHWTIFEALNHKDYDYWKRHLNKLLANYNSRGLKMLFLVTYIDNKGFSTITGRYVDLVKSHAPDGFKCISESAEELTDIFARDALGIKVWRCNYESDIGRMTVYHFFVHMEESIQPKDSQKDKAGTHAQ